MKKNLFGKILIAFIIFGLTQPVTSSHASTKLRNSAAEAAVGCGLLLGCLGGIAWLGAGVAAMDGNICASAAMVDTFRWPWESEEDIRLQKERKHRENMETAGRWFMNGLYAIGTGAVLVGTGMTLGSTRVRIKIVGLPSTASLSAEELEFHVEEGVAFADIDMEEDEMTVKLRVSYPDKLFDDVFEIHLKPGVDLVVSADEIDAHAEKVSKAN